MVILDRIQLIFFLGRDKGNWPFTLSSLYCRATARITLVSSY